VGDRRGGRGRDRAPGEVQRWRVIWRHALFSRTVEFSDEGSARSFADDLRRDHEVRDEGTDLHVRIEGYDGCLWREV
jgi:hypothetical protein